MAAVKTEAQYKQYFSGSFKGMDSIINDVFSPIFGTFSWKTSPTGKDYVGEYGNGGANIEHIYDYGNFDVNGPVSVWEVVLAYNCNISRARKNIQNTIRKITENYTGAFIVFHYAYGSDNPEAQTWRLSWLMRTNAQVRTSNPKRYTYLCGPSYSCRTIAERFDVLQNERRKTLDTITAAFDVEALSDEFFKEYKVIYDDIVQWITGQRIVRKGDKWKLDGKFGTGLGNSVLDMFIKEFGPDKDTVAKAVRDYVKKLMGRLVFIQFLQKKENWLKIDGKATSNFLLDLFNGVKDENKNNFIEKPLKQVVYLLLNNESRKSGDDEINGLTLDVPFLNGGLFEPDKYDNLKIQLPKEFFHNPDYQDAPRVWKKTNVLRPDDQLLTQCGMLDLFNHYNFTIDENDPNDAEMGVDPEMLGKIFENLLEDNKDKGAFYTPKEIVQYMCNESLIAYLQTKVPNHDDEIRQFVLDAEQKDVPEKEKILDALQEVKICDPAIGSGAFPMGLLNLLVALREKLEPSTQRVELKKSIIQNNIYGVDIEKGAIDIARLRFWLSIMVDEEKPTPLPNFEYKFMQGNSLLTTFDLQYVDIKQAKENRQVTAEINKKKQELYNKKNEYYGLSGEAKYKKEVEIKLLIVDILKLRLGFEKVSVEQQDTTRQMELFAAPDMPQNNRSQKKIQEVKEAQERVQRLIEKLLEIEKQLKAESKSWEEWAKTDILFFDWEICFAEIFPQDKPENERGFDIVIGNPPYGAKTTSDEKNVFKKIYDSAKTISGVQKGSTDTFSIFIELGYKCVVTNGVSMFIVPLSVTASDAMSGLHKLLIDHCDDVYISSYGDRPKRIFESAEQQVSIIKFRKSNNKCKHLMSTPINKRFSNESLWTLLDNLKFINTLGYNRNGRIPKVGDEIELNILTKLYKIKTKLGDLYCKNGSPIYYRKAGGRYYKIIMKEPTSSSAEDSIIIPSEFVNLVGASLSSTLFYWFWLIHSDWHNLRTSELSMFPIPFEAFSKEDLSKIEIIYNEYLDDLVLNSKTMKSGLRCYYARQSKKYIDKIDDFIGPKYGLTEEEIEFIKNYDSKYRNTEDEMEEIENNAKENNISQGASVAPATTGPSILKVTYQSPYESFGPNYGLELEYNYDTDDLQCSICGRGDSSKTLTPAQIKSIKEYLKDRRNIENFFNKAKSTAPNTSFTHFRSHDMSMEYGDRSKSVANGELMPWAEPFAKLC